MEPRSLILEALRGLRERYDSAAAGEIVEVVAELYGRDPLSRLLLSYYRVALYYLVERGMLDEAERLTEELIDAIRGGDEGVLRRVAARLREYAAMAVAGD